MKQLLDSIFDNWNKVNGVIGGIGQATLYGEKLTPEQFQETIDWFHAKGNAEFITNEPNYVEMGHKDTYHLWLNLPEVKVCCGFMFEGNCKDEPNMTKAVEIYKKNLTGVVRYW